MFTVRFWNKSSECVMVKGKYLHEFLTWNDAWETTKELLLDAFKVGAIEVDINNRFFPIVED